MSATDAAPVWADDPGPAPRPVKPAPTSAAAPAGRTTRVVLRRLDPWSVLRLSVLYYLALFVMLLVAGVLLWAGAAAVGAIENIEDFMESIGWEEFRFEPVQLLAGSALTGAVLVVCGTAANLLLAVLFNLTSDAVGGLKLTLQEDLPRRPSKGEGTATV